MGEGENYMLLKNCKLIKELSGNVPYERADIEIEDGIIKSVQESGFNVEYCGEVLDLKERYVLPGFIDLHVHLGSSAGRTLEDNIRPMAKQVLDGFIFAQDTLKAGFTTIRDVGSAYGLATGLREAINSGQLMGPNIIASGKILTPTEIGNDYFKGLYSEFNCYSLAVEKAREEFKAGADFIKVMGSGAFLNPGGNPGAIICLDEELKALADVAKLKNTHVAIHAHGAEAIKQAIRCGIRCIEHGSLVDEEGIKLLKTSDSYIIPTVIAMFTWDDDTKNNKSLWDYINSLTKQIEVSIKAAYNAGLKLGFGTDSGMPDCFHGQNADEFRVRYEIMEMRPLDILLQATKYSAEIINIDHKVGTIEEGKIADLVILDCDPIKDIISIKDSINMVIKSGKIV